MTLDFKIFGLNSGLLASLTLSTGLSIAFGYWIGKLQAEPRKFGKDEGEINEDYKVEDGHGSEPCKMVLVVRKDLPMTKGKIAAQCAHAAIGCYKKAIENTPGNVMAWKQQGQAKIALQCQSLTELQSLQMRAARLGVISERIVDAGRTQIEPGSVTVLGIGPAPISKVNEITGHLKLL